MDQFLSSQTHLSRAKCPRKTRGTDDNRKQHKRHITPTWNNSFRISSTCFPTGTWREFLSMKPRVFLNTKMCFSSMGGIREDQQSSAGNKSTHHLYTASRQRYSQFSNLNIVIEGRCLFRPLIMLLIITLLITQ